MRFLKTSLYSLNLWKTVCVNGTKASLVGFSPIEMCVNIGSSHQVTFCSLSSSLVFPRLSFFFFFFEHRHNLRTEADCGVCCASQVFLPSKGELTAVMAVSTHLVCLQFVSISFFM